VFDSRSDLSSGNSVTATWTCSRVLSSSLEALADWLQAANNVELAYTPTNASYLNRIEGHFAALRYFTLDGTDHSSHDPPLHHLAKPKRPR
jgi:hypothetical protein